MTSAGEQQKNQQVASERRLIWPATPERVVQRLKGETAKGPGRIDFA